MLAKDFKSSQVGAEDDSASYRVNVLGQTQTMTQDKLISILECLFPIKFTFSVERDCGVNAELIIEGDRRMAATTHYGHTASFMVPLPPKDPKLVDGRVHFADDPAVPFPFQGRTIDAKIPAQLEKLLPCNGERVLAISDGEPVWTIVEQGGASHFRSALSLPVIGLDGGLKDVLNEERFLEMVPLIHWLRNVCARTSYQDPPPRACFIFDDPNLHWPHYGFVNFGEIAARAAKESYHVSFATIPLDTWFTHCGAAKIFKNHPEHISLCVHGNNHIRGELAQHYTEAERANLLSQAIRRIEHLERKAGVNVSRVMVPPHGACLDEMLGDLPKLGFEAACISHGSLRAHNSAKLWTRTLGYLPSELIQGCPVLPRWGLSGSMTNTVLLAWFLKQPIIFRGHHQDLKDGVEVLDELAQTINGLGPVLWSNLSDLTRRNYQWRMQGKTCCVKPLSRKVSFPIPDSAELLMLEPPASDAECGWQITDSAGTTMSIAVREPICLSESLHGVISLKAMLPLTLPMEKVPKKIAMAAFFRRALTEGRDRFLS